MLLKRAQVKKIDYSCILWHGYVEITFSRKIDSIFVFRPTIGTFEQSEQVIGRLYVEVQERGSERGEADYKLIANLNTTSKKLCRWRQVGHILIMKNSLWAERWPIKIHTIGSRMYYYPSSYRLCCLGWPYLKWKSMFYLPPKNQTSHTLHLQTVKTIRVTFLSWFEVVWNAVFLSYYYKTINIW